MSEKWEVVGSDKKKKKVSNGQPAKSAAPLPSSVHSSPSASSAKTNGKVKQRRKFDVDYKVKPSEDPFRIPEPTGSSRDSNKSQQAKPKRKPSKPPSSSGGRKGNDLEAVLDRTSSSELYSFFLELKNAGCADDVSLSWVKYCADALNGRLNKIPTAETTQWPVDLYYPSLPASLEETIQRILSETMDSVKDDSYDVLEISYSSLLASLPNLAQRNDPAWGYLIFLREIVLMDPDVVLRRARSYSELMESYGNKKEVGICCLWVAAQASLNSTNALKIVTDQIVPFYNFKHYRSFTISVLGALGTVEPTTEVTVAPTDFVEFFDASFDPKRKRDFEKFYYRIKNSVMNNLNGNGAELFEILLPRLAKSDFMPLSVVGHETLDLLSCCVGYDSFSVVPSWQELVLKYPRESGVLLNYMVKNIEKLKNGKALELHFFKSSNFAKAALKNPELNRYAKKFQESLKKVEASRKRSSWWLYIVFFMAVAIGLVFFDVQENGKGLFSKSKSGKFLAQYGLLDDALYIGERTKSFATSVNDYAAPRLRVVYERIQPVLQTIDQQLQQYIPKVVEVFKMASEQVVLFGNYLAKEVFVGQLAPENLRKVALDALSLFWSYMDFAFAKVMQAVGQLVTYIKAYV